MVLKLTTEQWNQILMEVVLGMDHSLTGAEAEEAYAKIEAEVQEMAREGIAVELPNE